MEIRFSFECYFKSSVLIRIGMIHLGDGGGLQLWGSAKWREIIISSYLLELLSGIGTLCFIAVRENAEDECI